MSAGLALMGMTVGLLAYYQAHQRLGTPGVRVAPQQVFDSEGELISTNAVVLPERVLEFESTNQPIAKTVSQWLPKDTVYGQRGFKSTNGFELTMTVVLMGRDRTSIHKPEQCLVANGWAINGSEPTTVPISQPHPYRLPVMRLKVHIAVPAASGPPVIRQGYFVYWFVADQELTANHLQRMWWMGRDLAERRVLQRWAYVSCLAEIPPGQEDATWRRLCGFLDAAVPQFQTTDGSMAALAGRLQSPTPNTQ